VLSGRTENCATAARAVINNATFAGAFLFGVDFSNVTALGASFPNAVLVGANFTGARLMGDEVKARRVNLSSAYLQGANLSDAETTHDILLDNAFVDFVPNGNVLTVVLDSRHTNFPGYWHTPGTPVCAEMPYDMSSGVPSTDASVICPNGRKYPQGCGEARVDASNTNWASPALFEHTKATYLADSTFAKAPAAGVQACQVDVCWSRGLCNSTASH
jgi:uncharacterized protein YjbI with pentapeptide repeats